MYENYGVMIEHIGRIAQKVFTVTPANPRSLPSAEYAAHFSNSGIDAVSCETVAEGVQSAIDYARSAQIPLICLGSLYLYGELSLEINKTLR